MMERHITAEVIKAFAAYLREDEKSQATVAKYVRDVTFFADFSDGASIDKNLILSYKAHLEKEYALTSANSMIASLNTFFRFVGWNDMCVKRFKVQKKAYCSAETELTKDEYMRLLKAAQQKGNERLNMILQTICGTGIRVSELAHITVEAVKKGECVVSCKGKQRKIFLVSILRKKLLSFIKTNKIESGTVFVTKNGKPMNRSNIWREMKHLCKAANVSADKVFPHNLRHLFARTFYNIEKDMAKLADILGHTNINTTRIYIMTTGEEHRRKMEQMGLVL